MRRCTSCGTGMSPQAFRCWLCYAAAPQPMVDREPELLSNVTPMDHVRTGPLARTRQHGNPDPITAGILDPGSKHSTLGQRMSDYVHHVLGRR